MLFWMALRGRGFVRELIEAKDLTEAERVAAAYAAARNFVPLTVTPAIVATSAILREDPEALIADAAADESLGVASLEETRARTRARATQGRTT